jgi:hypothetical protein
VETPVTQASVEQPTVAPTPTVEPVIPQPSVVPQPVNVVQPQPQVQPNLNNIPSNDVTTTDNQGGSGNPFGGFGSLF